MIAVNVLMDDIMLNFVWWSRPTSAVLNHWCLSRLLGTLKFCNHTICLQPKCIEEHSLTNCKLDAICLRKSVPQWTASFPNNLCARSLHVQYLHITFQPYATLSKTHGPECPINWWTLQFRKFIWTFSSAGVARRKKRIFLQMVDNLLMMRSCTFPSTNKTLPANYFLINVSISDRRHTEQIKQIALP